MDPVEIRFDVPNEETFATLLANPLPVGLRQVGVSRSSHRDIYFDTADRSLERRSIVCRMRHRSDDRRILSLHVREVEGAVVSASQVFEAEVPDLDGPSALSGTSEPARRLRAYVDPERLRPLIELETERRVREGRAGRFAGARFAFVLDHVTVRRRDAFKVFHELKVKRLRAGRTTVEAVTKALADQYGLGSILGSKLERAIRRLDQLESEALARVVDGGREVALVALRQGRVAVIREGNALALPVHEGTGADSGRLILRQWFGTADGKLRLLGSVPAASNRPLLEVWVAERLPASPAVRDDRVQWVGLAELLSRVGSPLIRHAPTLAALAVVTRSGLDIDGFPDSTARTAPGDGRNAPDGAAASVLVELQQPQLADTALDAGKPVPDQFVNAELSWLEFNARVLELAEDPAVPLLARVRFLGIFASNLDEFAMVRVGALKHALSHGIETASPDGLTPREQLDAIAVRVGALVDREQQCFRAVKGALDRQGVRIRRWDQLNDDQRAAMRAMFDEQIFPVLTPQAMTRAPGHPFPHISNLALSLATMVRDDRSGPVHFANIRIPGGLPRFVPLGEGNGYDFVPIEEVVAANLDMLYPGRRVEAAYPFRVTRSGEIHFDEEGASNLLQAVEEEVRRRPFGTVVRIEVAADMPLAMRELLERELQFEEPDEVSTLTAADLYEVDDLIDLGTLSEIAEVDLPELDYPSFAPATPIDPARSIFETIAEGDILVHHPYDAFDSTVQRLIVDAAGDPDVVAIKLTLYRSGTQSKIADALMRAAGAGKDVSVFVELKARFDEERNIHWAKTLEQAGIHVVYGLVRLKTHAKTTLVVRREGDRMRRYVHVGTGNYNAATARFYTDLGLLSAHEDLGADLNDLFNELTGSSRPPQREFRRLLVAPNRMLRPFLALVEREIEHAGAGRGGRIRLKLNGLADEEMIGALYRASQAGVQIDIIVRAICCLRPGVPGLSEHIRVYSILGRFLEHARIYHFGNAGQSDYFIGSADWRPRNLRRRVEVVAPVIDAEACRRLDELLEAELDDATAWQMRSDGTYHRPRPPIGVERVSVQERLVLHRGVADPA